METDFSKKEKKILKLWKKEKVFEKSIENRKKAKNFVFYEGPPTANGRPGIHHVLSRVYKDVICRYKTMRGFRVLRKAGWDTHGLPVELEVEKKLGLKSKKDIEKYGVAKFNKKCKRSVWEYTQEWEKLTDRSGFWLDMKDPYITYNSDYIESVWWIFKKIYQRGLLYKGYKVVPYCCRCGTPLSSHEVAQGYKKVKDLSIYLKIPLSGEKNTYLLVWTTTPWTLPANAAVAVNPEFDYIKAKVSGDVFILAKERAGILEKYKEAEKIKGKDLVGLKYDFPYKFNKKEEYEGKKVYEVIPANFVALDSGTGLVHIAPAFGEDDMQSGKENNLPVFLNVDEGGKFKKEVKDWAGKFVKDADPLIIEDLRKKKLLFKEELYEHEYPFCWRCKMPLLYYAKSSWFVRVRDIKNKLIEGNKNINWTPDHLKKGRFGEWLKEVKDWTVSRERYWGTPLPVWECKKCGNWKVIGSRQDIAKQEFSSNNYYILRHGLNPHLANHKGIIYPDSLNFSMGLNSEGRRQIKDLLPKLKKANIDLIFSSDFKRTKETARIVAEGLGLKVILDKRLRDVNLGVYQGKPQKELYDQFSSIEERFYRAPEGGENWLECRKRMVDFIKEIDKKYKGKNILIVGHGDPLGLLEGAMKGLPKKDLVEKKLKKNIIKPGELREIKFASMPFDEKGEMDFHRPRIDELKFRCEKCGGLMERVPDVLDCWFDSGSMPFAQWHYPFENKEMIDKRKQFPADYIAEAIDQTRGWFYTLHVVSTLLKEEPAYKNVVSLGHILDEKGEKMSKSKGNIVNPWAVIGNYGADATRWYFYTINQPGDSKLFSEKDVEQALKRFIMTFWNIYYFFNTYVEKKEIPKDVLSISKRDIENVLDEWIISKLNNLVSDVGEKLDNYDVTGAAREIEKFAVEDFSQWYIRRSRKRFQDSKRKKAAVKTTAFVLAALCKIAAPFIPFLTEDIYKRLGQKKSVHLSLWPEVNSFTNKKAEEKMERVFQIVKLGLKERSVAGIKVRQPLNFAAAGELAEGLGEEHKDIIKEELNVKDFCHNPKIKNAVKIDKNITPELEEEGILREIIRNIQEMRKKAGLKPKNKVLVSYSAPSGLESVFEENEKFILKEAKIEKISRGRKPKEVFAVERNVKLKRENSRQDLWLAIKKVGG